MQEQLRRDEQRRNVLRENGGYDSTVNAEHSKTTQAQGGTKCLLHECTRNPVHLDSCCSYCS